MNHLLEICTEQLCGQTNPNRNMLLALQFSDTPFKSYIIHEVLKTDYFVHLKKFSTCCFQKLIYIQSHFHIAGNQNTMFKNIAEHGFDKVQSL
jgi:hypothetical protein